MYKYNRLSLLSSEARIQVPWVKVTFKGANSDYTFGIFINEAATSDNKMSIRRNMTYNVRYPNYIKSLTVTKINGQVNQYTLNINYPVTQNDDPNFFEKIFSSISKTRKVIFTYGDAAVPSFIYKNEEAIITTITQQFNLESSSISYSINAVSGAALDTPECLSFPACTAKPSTKIKEVFNTYGLSKVFTGMSSKNWSNLIAMDDATVDLSAQTNISALDYLTYLVSCMYPVNNSSKINPTCIYVLTIHDDSTYDETYTYNDLTGDARNTDRLGRETYLSGPYFKVSKVSYNAEKSDAYELDIGYNTSTIVTQFSIENNENYSLYYEHQMELANDQYVRRLDNNGKWIEVYSPTVSSKNSNYITQPENRTWWTKITQFPINASVTVQGLLRPAKLLTYVRLNVIFPGGHRHISSGLYIVTKQQDTIDESGYKTQLSLTRVGAALTSSDHSTSADIQAYNQYM